MSAAQDKIVPEGYAVDDDGVWFDRGDSGWQRLASTPAWVSALTRDASAQDWSILIAFVNRDGGRRSTAVPYASILSGGSTLTRDLAARGLLVLPSGEALFRNFLAESAGDAGMPRQRATRKLGFASLPVAGGARGLAFALPKRTLVSAAVRDAGEILTFQPPLDSPAFAAYHARGTLAEWQAMVAPLGEHPLFVFALCAGLAGPFVELAGLDNAILHFHGPSSVGKTTMLQLGASLWGAALDPQHSGTRTTLIERWNVTGNAMELLTATHSGIGLYIDELGGNTEPLLSVYNMTSGRGKQRMTDAGGLRAQLRWSLFVLSSGELALVEKVEAGSGRRAKTGERIRALDIPVADLAGPAGLGEVEAGLLAQRIKQQCGETYGTAGPAFVQDVLDHFATEEDLREELRAEVDSCYADLCDAAAAAGLALQPPHRRALRRFALVATVGAWAEQTLGLDQEVVLAAVTKVALAWLAAVPPLSEAERIRAEVRDYLLRHEDDILDYDAVAPGDPVPDLGAIRAVRHREWLLLPLDGLAEACPDTPPQAAAKALAAQGLLHREHDKLTSRHVLTRIGLGREAYYALIERRLFPQGDGRGTAAVDEAAEAP